MVELEEFIFVRNADADAVPDHQIDEHFPIDQYNLGRYGAHKPRLGAGGHTGGSDPVGATVDWFLSFLSEKS